MNHKVITPEQAYEDIRRVNGEVGILLGNIRQIMPRAMVHTGAEKVITNIIQTAIGNHITLLEDRNELIVEMEQRDGEELVDLMNRRTSAMKARKDL